MSEDTTWWSAQDTGGAASLEESGVTAAPETMADPASGVTVLPLEDSESAFLGEGLGVEDWVEALEPEDLVGEALPVDDSEDAVDAGYAAADDEDDEDSAEALYECEDVGSGIYEAEDFASVYHEDLDSDSLSAEDVWSVKPPAVLQQKLEWNEELESEVQAFFDLAYSMDMPELLETAKAGERPWSLDEELVAKSTEAKRKGPRTRVLERLGSSRAKGPQLEIVEVPDEITAEGRSKSSRRDRVFESCSELAIAAVAPVEPAPRRRRVARLQKAESAWKLSFLYGAVIFVCLMTFYLIARA